MLRTNTLLVRWCTVITAMLMGVSFGLGAQQGRCQESSRSLPEHVYGSWLIKSVYGTHNVTGLSKTAERRLIGSRVTFTRETIKSCGISVPIASTEQKTINEEEFFAEVYVHFTDVGVTAEAIDEVLIDSDEAGDCNGTGTLPGAHFFIKSPTEILIQYQGGFFKATKVK